MQGRYFRSCAHFFFIFFFSLISIGGNLPRIQPLKSLCFDQLGAGFPDLALAPWMQAPALGMWPEPLLPVSNMQVPSRI